MPLDLAVLPPLDLDSELPPSEQIASRLRAAILRGDVVPGERLPSQSQLAEYFGVARMTVQKATDALQDGGLTASRHGAGTYVLGRAGRPVGLRPHVEAAFAQEVVNIRFAGYTGETLHTALQEPLDKIRTGRLAPKELTVHMLLIDMTHPVALPVRTDLRDDERLRQRIQRLTDRYALGLVDSVAELNDMGLLDESTVVIRKTSLGLATKMYCLNNSDVFFGFYPIRRHAITVTGEAIDHFDPMGKDATLMHFARSDDPDALGSVYVDQANKWFDSIWHSIALPYEQ